jgi:hypothetical protein
MTPIIRQQLNLTAPLISNELKAERFFVCSVYRACSVSLLENETGPMKKTGEAGFGLQRTCGV